MSNFKRLILVLSLFTLISFTGCAETGNSNNDSKVTYTDGTYSAQEQEFNSSSGYQDTVEVTVSNGLITDVTFNGYNQSGLDKITESVPGGSYDMSVAGATLTWAEQAKLIEGFIIENQDPNAIILDTDGYSDSVAGVTIKVKNFVELANQALSTAIIK